MGPHPDALRRLGPRITCHELSHARLEALGDCRRGQVRPSDSLTRQLRPIFPIQMLNITCDRRTQQTMLLANLCLAAKKSSANNEIHRYRG